MLVVLSPSKTLDFVSALPTKEYSQPALLDKSQSLVAELKKFPPKELGKLMSISGKLATLNAQRYKKFKTPFTPKNARPALFAFKGDVYEGFDLKAYSVEDYAFAQSHIRILSGLYGLLRPLDLIQPYRLEMGTRLATQNGKDLYQFWGNGITEEINKRLAESDAPTLVNLASEEYFKAVKRDALKGKIVNIVFKEKRGERLQIIGLLAKKARGQMADFIIRRRITDVNQLRFFAEDGYRFNPATSSPSEMVFVRTAKKKSPLPRGGRGQ